MEQTETKQDKALIKRRWIKTAAVAVPAVLIILCGGLYAVKCKSDMGHYNRALGYIDNGMYEGACEILYSLGDYKDAPELYSSILSRPTHSETKENNGNSYTTEYTYDACGNMTRSVTTAKDGETETTVCTYDGSGKKTTEEHTDKSGVTSVTEYIYNDDGRLGKAVCTSENGDVSTTEYTYDERGGVACEAVTLPNGTTKKSYTHEYDENGRMTKETYSYKGGKSTERNFSYDKSGNVIKEERVIPNGNSSSSGSSAEYTYENGVLVKEIYTDTNGTSKTTEYFNYQFFKAE